MGFFDSKFIKDIETTGKLPVIETKVTIEKESMLTILIGLLIVLVITIMVLRLTAPKK